MEKKTIIFKCSEKLYNEIEADAKENGTTKADTIRTILREYYHPGSTKYF